MFDEASKDGPIYLDYAATTPVSERVAAVVNHYMTVEFGNSGSRTHEWGTRAKKAVAEARAYLAFTMDASPEELIFTSGATESNNLAILGLAEYGRETGRMHLVTSATEHKAVLEPMEHLAKQGFEVDFLRPGPSGRFSVEDIMSNVREDTLLVSLMHVNNETGVMQPTVALAEALAQTRTYFHVDSAQGYAKYPEALRAPIDLISISGHKIGAPKGIGALLLRRRGWSSPPVHPLMFGGGQEKTLRPGTLPVALIAGLHEAAKGFAANRSEWNRDVTAMRRKYLGMAQAHGGIVNGDPDHFAPHILNVSLVGQDAEAVLLAWRDLAFSVGSACNSATYAPSHVLTAMGLSQDRVSSAIRLSFNG